MSTAFLAGVAAYCGRPGNVTPDVQAATRADKTYQPPQ